MKSLTRNFDQYVREADGFEGVEYAAMTALIVSAVIGALVVLGMAIAGSIGSIVRMFPF